MSRQLLIDTLVRQSMVMVARLATSRGSRAPVAHLAEQVFRDLTEELRSQGIGHKVIADMFGMSLRAYHLKVRRLAQTLEERHRSLWQAIVGFLESRGAVSREEILQRFRNDDPVSVIGIVNDLVANGWVQRQGGETQATTFRLVTAVDDDAIEDSPGAIASMVWVLVRREGPLERRAFASLVPALAEDRLDAALDTLERDGRIRRYVEHGQEHFTSEQCVIPRDAKDGWMGAVIDHFGAVVNTLCARAEGTLKGTPFEPYCGGSTFRFEMDASHPLYEEVLEHFRYVRAKSSALRVRVDEHNAASPPRNPTVVIFYAGQHVVPCATDGQPEMSGVESDPQGGRR